MLKAFLNSKDFLTGLIVIAIAGVFAWGIPSLPLGTAFQMGPGYFPLVLVILLVVVGVIIMLNGLRSQAEAVEPLPWWTIATIALPVVFFGATVRGLGLAPSLSIAVFVTTFAHRPFHPGKALLLTAAIVAFCSVVFLWGLDLPLPLYGPWLGGG